MLGTTEILVIAGVAIVLFGADRVPKLARGLGQAKKEFLTGQSEADAALHHDGKTVQPDESPATKP